MISCDLYSVLPWLFRIGRSKWMATSQHAHETMLRKFLYMAHMTLPQDELNFDADAIKKIRDLNIINYEECRDCFAKYHCAEDCPDRRLSNRISCDAIRQVGSHILNQKIDA